MRSGRSRAPSSSRTTVPSRRWRPRRRASSPGTHDRRLPRTRSTDNGDERQIGEAVDHVADQFGTTVKARRRRSRRMREDRRTGSDHRHRTRAVQEARAPGRVPGRAPRADRRRGNRPSDTDRLPTWPSLGRAPHPAPRGARGAHRRRAEARRGAAGSRTQLGAAAVVERWHAGHHLVHRRAQPVHVGGRRGRLATEELR